MSNIYNDLKSKQQDFIRTVATAALDEGMAISADTTYSRGWLRKVAQSVGIAWAPAWIVKDVSRQRGRGEYLVPEVQVWLLNQNTDDDNVADQVLEVGNEIADRILGEETDKSHFDKAMDEHEAMEREMNAI